MNKLIFTLLSTILLTSCGAYIKSDFTRSFTALSPITDFKVTFQH